MKTIIYALVLCCSTGAWVSADDYEDQIRRWRNDHEEKFKSLGGWLALTGHYWLSPGENRFGSQSDLPVVLQADAAGDTQGIITVTDKHVTFQVTQGDDLLLNDQPVRSGTLRIEPGQAEINSPDKLQLGTRLTLQLVRRTGKLAIRVRDSQSPSIRQFQGKKWFPIQPKYRVQATFQPLDQPKLIKIVNIRGAELELPLAGTLTFQLDGQQITVDALLEEPDSLAVIFKDQTCGKSTYGAGRFVDVAMPKSGDTVWLDFNQAYSPPCAWSPHTLCPLPPKQNHLDVAIEAGERQ